MNEIIKIDAPELQIIKASKAEQIKETFEPMVEMLYRFEKSYNDIIIEAKKEITEGLTVKAKILRLDIGRVRIDTGKLKDKAKAEILLEGKAIQGVHNIIVWAVTDKENSLKEIENHFEILEKKRIEAIQLERAKMISPYLEDAFDRNLSGMEDDVWEAYFGSKKKAEEDRIEAEEIAERERIAKEKAEIKEQQRIKAENERLKKEAEEAEKKAKIEQEKRNKEREKYEAKIKAEREETERVKKIEKEKREKLEAELKAKEDSEKKVAQDAKKKKESELYKGDTDKVKDLINDLEILKTKYVFKSKKSKNMYLNVCILIVKMINYVQKNS